MITTAEIELIGYVGKDPIIPKPQEYPNFITFPVGVSRIWKDKVLCARYTSPPLRQMRSPLYTNFFVSYCHPPF